MKPTENEKALAGFALLVATLSLVVGGFVLHPAAGFVMLSVFLFFCAKAFLR